jgi:hypothetical protein
MVRFYWAYFLSFIRVAGVMQIANVRKRLMRERESEMSYKRDEERERMRVRKRERERETEREQSTTMAT